MPATVIHTKTAQCVSNDEAESFVTAFLDSQNSDSMPDGVAKQLQRLQRELRGLPPIIQTVSEQE